MLRMTNLVGFGVRQRIPPPLDAISVDIGLGYRLLRSAYTGSCVRVRRSSDNAEADIGFANGLLNETALLDHCGSGSGFVRTLYDQSGGARNAGQSINGNQPRIVNAGVIERRNGRPCSVAVNTSSHLLATITDVDGLTDLTLNAVGATTYASSINDTSPAFMSVSEDASWGAVYLTPSTTEIGWRFGTGEASNNRAVTASVGTGLNIISLQKQSGTETARLNGSAAGSSTGRQTTMAGNSTNFYVGSSPYAVTITGLVTSEIILHRAFLAATPMLGLERNQGAYFGIATP